MTLLWPGALLALAALLLPLLIHLSRRLRYTRTSFAAMRWVQAGLRPRQRLRLRDLLLMLLRMLLIVVAVLLLAQAQRTPATRSAPWVVVAPEASSADVARWRTEAPADGIWVWLATGFPAFTPGGPSSVVTADARAGASLLRELDRQLPVGTELTVLLPQQWSGADGQRLRLSRAVQWQVLGEPVAAGASAAAAPIPQRFWPGSVQVYSDAEGQGALRFVRAALAGWNAVRGTDESAISLKERAQPGAPSEQSDLLVWLAAEPMPDAVLSWIRAGGTALVDLRSPVSDALLRLPLARSEDGAALAEAMRLDNGRIVQLRQPLALDAWPQLAQGEFALQLHEWLWPGRELMQAPQLADGAALVPLPDERIQSAPPPRPLHAALALLLAGLFVLERLLAGGARRGSS